MNAILDGRTHLDLILVIFAILVMPTFSAVSGARLARTPPEQRNLIARYWQTIARGWIVAALIMVFWRITSRPFADLGLDWPIGIMGWLGFGLDAIAVVVLAVQLERLPRQLANRLDVAHKALARIKITPRTGKELALFILVAITAGVWEELLYRGFLIWYLVPFTGTIGAIAVSSIMFGLGHSYQGWRGVVVTTAVGFALAILYMTTHSLWWLMLAHALIDIYGGIASYRIGQLLRRSDGDKAPTAAQSASTT